MTSKSQYFIYICDYIVTFMPKQTFLKLTKEKQKLITDAFMLEFALHPYDKASLSKVVEQLGIAKGSIYQYFGSKQQLFLDLIEVCNKTKSNYLLKVERPNYPDFWTYFVAIFEKGLDFDAENSLQSHFLFNLTQNLNSPSIKSLYDKMLEQVVQVFEQMVTYEVEQGLFRKDIPIPILGFMLYKVGLSIQEHLQFLGMVKPEESVKSGKAVYHHKKEVLLNHVAQYIQLAKPAFNSKSKEKPLTSSL